MTTVLLYFYVDAFVSRLIRFAEHFNGTTPLHLSQFVNEDDVSRPRAENDDVTTGRTDVVLAYYFVICLLFHINVLVFLSS